MAEKETVEQAAPELLPCPWCPTERRETHQTEAGAVGVITHETGCYLARHEDERRQVLTPWGVKAWNSRAISALPLPVETPAPERIWIQPNESNLSGVGPIWFTRRTGSGDIEYVRAKLSPSGAEQLSELRRVAKKALEWFAGFPHHGDASTFDLATAHEVYEQLCAVLNPQPEKETQ